MSLFPRQAGLVPALLLFAALAIPARAGDVTLTVTTPTNNVNRTATVNFNSPNKGGRYASVPVTIKPGMSATEKRDAIVAAITANKVPKFTVAGKGTDQLTISSLQKDSTVSFDAGLTGETMDTLTASLTPGGTIDWGTGVFATLDAFGAPALFTGGLITDNGTSSFSITSAFLGVTPGSAATVSGAQIDQALFGLLNPAASAFGATLTVNTTSFDLAFDPSVTHGESGILFGTTALSSGLSGTLIVPIPEVSTPASFGLLLALGWGGVLIAAKRPKRSV